MLEKSYSPAETEARRYASWEGQGAFACAPDSNAVPFTIMIPPPNVTGSLHVGHALTFTIQDTLVRWRRMQGRDALWQPGTDHAGIATQMVVERLLADEGTSRQALGREKFIDRVWQWKGESGGTITRQLRRMGASVDWSRERFTMDEGLSAAVLKVFVELYRAGLIYRDKRLVNWDPHFQTAISDLEVEQREIKGHLWHFKYPIEGADGQPGGEFIVVATTRPETMLGDTGIAVHPSDERYKHLVGKNAILPLVGRRIPIVADEYADPEQGSGAVKITPAHDFNDFEVGKRNGLEAINILTADAHLNDTVPEPFRGLDRFEARKRVIAALEELGLVEKIEPHTHMVPHGDRSGVPIEPWLTTQWYADAKTLAQPAIEAVRSGKTAFVPENWAKTYFHWMENIQPWSISRQLWWGHQVPAWYGPDGAVFVDYDEAGAAAQAETHYGKPAPLTRDPDVLDTWFSSALWPFSTLGWPERTPELKRHYPTDVLVTGFDIIFFWVARMMMMGLHFMKEVPFSTVYIHALVRDEKGQKMSKSKGNVLDPLALIEKFGADAVRFTLTALAAQGRDIKLSESRIEGYRNFATKIWNAARFGEMNQCRVAAGYEPARNAMTVNRWIVSELVQAARACTAAIEAFKFNEAAQACYQFVWSTYCDWYLEFIKPVLQGGDEAAKAETRATAAWVLHQALHLLHPMMPFVTEELWEKTGGEGLLITAPWPDFADALLDPAAEAELGWVVRLVSQIRTVRSEMNVPVAAKIPLLVKGAAPETDARLARHRDVIATLARLASIEAAPEAPKGAVQIVLDEATLVLPLADVIDLAQERARLDKELKRLDGEIAKIDAKLGNQSFVAKAPPEVVEEQKERREEAVAARAKLSDALTRLAAA
ncbi:MAG: valine--tRNA ligase [Rhodospirillaceae bacterium]|nr:valine--tRNA ligase [Rhodospirillaceae bacterium]